MNRISLKEKIKEAPASPGVYQFLDGSGKVIYVGKAKDLRKRVKSYFQEGRARDKRLMLMRKKIRDVKFIETSSEAEALICEAGVIKEYSPLFNIELKDDKSYPFLKLTMNEEYPRLFITRRRKNDGAVYYGPYVNVALLRKAVSFMKKVFPLKRCNRMPKKVCLEFHIGQCEGPCEGKIDKEEYREMVKDLQKFLEGKKGDLIGDLQKKMTEYAERQQYEKALAVKERVRILSDIRRFHDRSKMPIYGELEELQHVLKLPDLPVTIECFDISNLKGMQSVGSMVRFVSGKPDKNSYRKFRIKSVLSPDDYAMIREVVRRRYSRLLKEGRVLPKLVLIDGGKGHLRSAQKELEELKLELPVASIAKEFNHIYIPQKRGPVRLAPGRRALLLIQRIRDEAHRFAIEYHRSLRKKTVFHTSLRNIKGVGPAKEKLLLDKLGDLRKIKKADKRTLLKIGLDGPTADKIINYYREG